MALNMVAILSYGVCSVGFSLQYSLALADLDIQCIWKQFCICVCVCVRRHYIYTIYVRVSVYYIYAFGLCGVFYISLLLMCFSHTSCDTHAIIHFDQRPTPTPEITKTTKIVARTKLNSRAMCTKNNKFICDILVFTWSTNSNAQLYLLHRLTKHPYFETSIPNCSNSK